MSAPPIIHTPNGSSTPSNGHSNVKYKVLVADRLNEEGVTLLRKTLDVDVKTGLPPAELESVIGEYEALVVRSDTQVTRQVLEAGKKLKVVARAGVGVDNIDVPTATKQGVIVVNSPLGNIGSAAELTIGLLMSMARNIPEATASLKAGKWNRSKLTGMEVQNKTLGIVGLGKVGMQVARIAHLGLGMRIEALDPYASPNITQTLPVKMASSLQELLPNCDFLTIHTPLIASTKGMIGDAELKSMKKGARVLNVARGGLIDETALLSALESGHIAGAAIDVFPEEPVPENSASSKLLAHPKCVSTPHLGASTAEAQVTVAEDVCEQIISILSGDMPRSAVNAPMILPEEYKTLQPFVRLVEKMGSMYTQHYTQRESGHTDTSTTFDLIYEGALAELSNTKPLFASLIKGLTAPISSTNVNIVNAQLVADQRGIQVNEQHSRVAPEHNYSSLVTLRARPTVSSRSASPYAARTSAQQPQQQQGDARSPPLLRSKSSLTQPGADRSISGFISGGHIYISRLDKFATAFVPEGNIVICHNYDAPGKIGAVGSRLGKAGVNINFMTVAPLSLEGETGKENQTSSKEALMILGVDREISKDIVEGLESEQGILDVSALSL